MSHYFHKLLLVILCLPINVLALSSEDMAKLFSEGSVGLDFRYRYEGVDDDGVDDRARASTLRSRINFTSAEKSGLSLLLELDDVTSIGSERYNSTENGNTQYPVVADPEGTDVNQAWINASWGELDGRYGRQRINHNNQRFVGGVGWRQNEQTYDGVRLTFGGKAETFTIDYSYVYNINRIFGPDDGAQPASWHGENHLLFTSYKLAKKHRLKGFAYSLDIDPSRAYSNARTVDNSGTTLGVEYVGKFAPFKLRAAYAHQVDGGSSSLDYSANYHVLELSGKVKLIDLKMGVEVLGSDNGVGFKTPLATLHKFQGWTDKFLATPADGIEDIYFGVGGTLGPVKLSADIHSFSAERGGADFGHELDLAAKWQIRKSIYLLFKYATFEADREGGYRDTDKAWLTLGLKF